MSFSIIVISPETTSNKETEQVARLFDNGLKAFHLRKPTTGKKALEQYLQEIPAKYYKKIVLHSHFALAATYGLKGIHLNENAKKDQTDKNSKIVSAAFHSLEQLNKNTRQYTYVFLSPLFDSISKAGYKGSIDLEKVEKFFKKKRKEKVVALGGISKENISIVKQIGFSGAALIGAIWQSNDPVKSYLRIVSEVE